MIYVIFKMSYIGDPSFAEMMLKQMKYHDFVNSESRYVRTKPIGVKCKQSKAHDGLRRLGGKHMSLGLLIFPMFFDDFKVT